MTNMAIFVSGNGTNCENIIRYFKGGTVAEPVLVVSNRADAYALTRAKNLGVDTVVVSKAEFNDESLMNALLARYGVGFIVLAGFLLMIPRFLIGRYSRRMVNIHPALLPKYGGKGMYGHHVHEAVCANHEKESGITIHYVSELCDGGETIFQAKTEVLPTDTPEDVARKVHVLEQRYFPAVIEMVISDGLDNPSPRELNI